MENEIIMTNFRIRGKVLSVEPYGNGHINRTFLVVTEENKYILQAINTYAFKDTDLLMNNISYVTTYLSSLHIETLEIIPTNDGKLYFRDGKNCYRVYQFVMESLCIEKATDMSMVYTVAKAYGIFHKTLAGLDASKLGEVIPHFHDTVKRYNDFLNALKEDKLGRAASCKAEIAAIQGWVDKYSLITDGLKDGSIHLAVTHNDPKINNVLFDQKTKEVRCVIDLDTIMPGSVLYDFGDALRSLFSGENEDSRNLDLLVADENIYRNYLNGYLSEMGSVLTEKEKELLPMAPFVMTIECGMRFLEDYLRGDVYFHTTYPEHNLVRARTQIRLSENILKAQEKFRSFQK